MKIGRIEGNDYDSLIMNDAILAFHSQINANISRFPLIDSILDEYEDETGINTGSSINILYNPTGDYYSLGEGDITDIDDMEYATDNDAQTAYVASDATNFQSYSEDTIKEEGSYSLKMVATQTDSLNDVLTKTFSSPLDLSNKDTIKLKARSTRTGTNLRAKIHQQPVSAVKLLLHFDGVDGSTSNIKDYSQSNHSSQTFVGATQLKTSNKKWGNSSIWFDGNEDYLQIPDSADWDIFASNVDDWTIDFWVKFDDYNATCGLISQSENSSNCWFIAHGASGFSWRKRTNGTYDFDTGNAGKINDIDWHHVCAIKVANKYAIYVDGTQVNYVEFSGTDTFNGDLRLGYYRHGATVWLSGYLDDVRIVHSNIFSANPNNTPDDTIDVPTGAHNMNTHDFTISSANIWETKEWDISSLANSEKDIIKLLEFEIINADSVNTIYIDDMYAYTNPIGFTLISENISAVVEPDEGRLVILMEEVNAITLNTDLKGWVSRDDGVTWAQVTLEDAGFFDTNDTIKVLTGFTDLDVSGIGSGTDMVYKITTHNNKNCKIHATSNFWR